MIDVTLMVKFVHTSHRVATLILALLLLPAATRAQDSAVRIKSPQPKQQVERGKPLIIEVESTLPQIRSMELRVNDKATAAKATMPPYRFRWETAAVGPGPHHLTAVATLPDGSKKSSEPVIVVVALPRPRTIAVIAFTAAGGSPSANWVGLAASETLATKLGKIRGLKPLERLQLETILREQKLTEEGIVDPATAARAGQLLTADYVIRGDVKVDGDPDKHESARIDVSCSLIEVASTRLLGMHSVTGTLDGLFDLENSMATRLAEMLNIVLTEADRRAIAASKALNVQAYRYISEGRLATHRMEFDRALEQLRKAAELAPDEVVITYYLADVALRLKRYDEAIPALERLHGAKPGNEGIKNSLWNAYVQVVKNSVPSEVFASEDKRRTFIDVLCRALKIHPYRLVADEFAESLIWDLHWSIVAGTNSELIEKVRQFCQDELTFHPNCTWLMCVIGDTYLAQKQFDLALQWYRRADEPALRPVSMWGYLCRVILHAAQGDLEEATQTAQEMIARGIYDIDYWDVMVLTNLWWSFEAQGKQQEGLKALERLAEACGKWKTSLSRRYGNNGPSRRVSAAKVMLFLAYKTKQSQPDRALKWMERALDMAPVEFPEGWIAVSRFYLERKDFLRAMESARRGLAIHNQEAYWNVAYEARWTTAFDSLIREIEEERKKS